jgi:1,2-diacylglycerol 3-alpha-glucosyltransferase
MQVLMLSDVYFPRVNGVSTSIQTFRAGLSAQGVEVRLIAPAYGGADDGDPLIQRVPGRAVPFDPEDRICRTRHIVTAAMQPANAQHSARPDIIHIQTPFAAHYAGIELACRYSVPVIATYHTFFEEYLHHYLPLLPKAVTRYAARRLSRAQCNALDAVVVPSAAMGRRLMEYGVEMPIHVLPTGVPLRQFADRGKVYGRARFRALHRIPERQPVALYVGRIAHEKNIDFLLRVAARCRVSHPDLLWIIAGEGPALPALKEMAQRLGIADRVRFLGYLDRQSELPDCYSAADLFTFASRTETQGLVLLEAMAMGLPVVALAEMGTLDIVQPQRGAVMSHNDEGHFAASVSQLLANPAERQVLGEEARRFARGWSDAAMAEKLSRLYRQLRSRVGTEEEVGTLLAPESSAAQ